MQTSLRQVLIFFVESVEFPTLEELIESHFSKSKRKEKEEGQKGLRLPPAKLNLNLELNLKFNHDKRSDELELNRRH